MSTGKIAITMGDAAGIGPEIILKSLSYEGFESKKLILIGCFRTFEATNEALSSPLSLIKIDKEDDLRGDFDQKIPVYDPKNIDLSSTKPGKISKESAAAAMHYIETAVSLCQKGIACGIATAPLNKEGIQKAGYSFNGHTDFLASLTDTDKYSMMFVHEDIKILLVTIHEPLNKISSMLSAELIFDKIKQAKEAANLFGIKKPKIAIAGFNPHAGENSLFGHEEEEHIIPAVKQALDAGIDIEGPIPPDTLFYRGITHKEFDIIVSIYHDQGLIPFKMVAFDKGVNLTIGLPFIRTSPDHGTAYNIAGKMNASADSMANAIKTALFLAKQQD